MKLFNFSRRPTIDIGGPEMIELRGTVAVFDGEIESPIPEADLNKLKANFGTLAIRAARRIIPAARRAEAMDVPLDEALAPISLDVIPGILEIAELADAINPPAPEEDGLLQRVQSQIPDNLLAA